MQLNIFNNIANEIKKVDVNNFIQEILERLNKMEEELVVDRIEGNIAICEDRKTGKKIEIMKENLSEDIVEGDVIIKKEEKYVKDIEKQKEIEKRIEDKMNSIWKN